MCGHVRIPLYGNEKFVIKSFNKPSKRNSWKKHSGVRYCICAEE